LLDSFFLLLKVSFDCVVQSIDLLTCEMIGISEIQSTIHVVDYMSYVIFNLLPVSLHVQQHLVDPCGITRQER
jgi:hypothetical protein